MTPLHVAIELPTTVRRAWEIFTDPGFQGALRTTMAVSEVKELHFHQTADELDIDYIVTMRKSVPEWVKRILSGITVQVHFKDQLDRRTGVMKTSTRHVTYSNLLVGDGEWRVYDVRPGWVKREFVGTLQVNVPVLGGKMEEKLAEAVTTDFQDINRLLAEWVQRDVDALAKGQPLPVYQPPRPLE